jgi:flagellar motor switch protein FliM
METLPRANAQGNPPGSASGIAVMPAEASGASKPGENAPTASQRPYDFFGGARFSAEVLAALTNANDRFSRRLVGALSRILRLEFQAATGSVRAGHHRALCQGLNEQAIVHLLDLPPLPGRGLLAIDSNLTFTILDRLMGGPGQGLVENRRDLTDIERDMMQIIHAALIEALKSGWTELAAVNPQVGATVSEGSVAKMALPTDPAVLATVEVVVRENRGLIRIVLPGPMVQSLATRASREELPQPAAQSRGHHQADLKSHLDAVSVPVCAVLGFSNLSMQDLLDLRPGDIIRLNARADQEVSVAIGDQKAYLGRPGRLGERMAVQITSIAVQPGESAAARQVSPLGLPAQTKEQ